MFKILSEKFTSKDNNAHAQKFLAMDGDTYFYNRYLEKKINPYLRGRVLECCSAVSTNYLKYPKNTISVDINHQMLKHIVNDNIPVAADIQRLPFTSDTFDSILTMHGIHHVGEDKVHYLDYIKPVIIESHRILKKGGNLIIVEGGVSHFVHLLIYALHFIVRSISRDVYHKYDFPLLYSKRVMDKFFPGDMFSLIQKEKIRLPRSLYFRCEPMFCFKFPFPLILLPQRPVIYVLQKK